MKAFMDYMYKYAIVRDNLILTGGATHGLHLVTSYLFKTGDRVFVEDPTYFIAIKLLKDDLGMELVTGIIKQTLLK